MDFINEVKIEDHLLNNKQIESRKVREIIEKSLECKGLNYDDVATLLHVQESELLNEIFNAARVVKDKIYGKRVVLFAPLYTSNECCNNCLYCGFRRDNKELHRRTLSLNEIVDEAKTITNQGHKRILLICGEDPRKTNIKHITSAMDAIYKNTDTRRINVETAPMKVDEYRELKEAGVGTYVIFQETYSREVYKKMHPVGTKSDYDYRLTAIDRAFEAGIDDVGIGALFGLNDYKFEVLASLMHANSFEQRFGVGPHTISVPRLRPAIGWALDKVPSEVNDDDFKKIVAIYRLAVPYTGIILSTRENEKLRDELMSLGVSQLSAGSKTNPGGYKENDSKADQFSLYDHRSLDQMVKSICEKGYIPSFCTACYRRCRTGENFMEYAKSGEIHEFCQPNAILTFKENLLDYADEEMKRQGEALIKKALKDIEDENMRKQTEERLVEIEQGKRDIYF